MTYIEWCNKVGIIPDTESREAWDYQQKRIDNIFDKVEDIIIEGDDSPKCILHEPFRSMLSNVQDLCG